MSTEINISELTKGVTITTPRTLPVILLLDASGSMNDNGKIIQLNEAVREMIGEFAKNDSTVAKINVAVITFGGASAQLHQPLVAADQIQWHDLTADGMTPMGDALKMAKEMSEDKTIMANTYKPTIILVSDGMPNDSCWQEELDKFTKEGKSSKYDRMAMGIEVSKNSEEYDVLKQFVSNPEMIFQAKDATSIRKFFRFLSRSITKQSLSQNPNVKDKSEPKLCELDKIENDDMSNIELNLDFINKRDDDNNEETSLYDMP